MNDRSHSQWTTESSEASGGHLLARALMTCTGLYFVHAQDTRPDYRRHRIGNPCQLVLNSLHGLLLPNLSQTQASTSVAAGVASRSAGSQRKNGQGTSSLGHPLAKKEEKKKTTKYIPPKPTPNTNARPQIHIGPRAVVVKGPGGARRGWANQWRRAGRFGQFCTRAKPGPRRSVCQRGGPGEP